MVHVENVFVIYKPNKHTYLQETANPLVGQCRRFNEKDLDKLPRENPNTRTSSSTSAGVDEPLVIVRKDVQS